MGKRTRTTQRWRLLLFASVLAMILGIGAPAYPVAAHEVSDSSSFVEVPTYTQQRNLSCEYASMVIAMGAYDTWVSEWAFDEMVPQSDNPHWGYRGDINGWWGNTTDYGVYPEPLVDPLAQLGFRGEVFYAQGEADALTRFLDNDVPVVLWLGLWGDQSFYEYASDGTPYKLNAGYHVVVAYGYDESGVYAADPATGGVVSWAWGDFMWMWNALDGMSLAVWPLATADKVSGEFAATTDDDAATAAVAVPGVCC